MNTNTVHHDERTESVENASYRLAYLVVSFGILIAVIYRAFVFDQSSWDLLALVIGGGAVATFYQGRHGVLTSRWVIVAVATAAAAAAVAAGAVLFFGSR